MAPLVRKHFKLVEGRMFKEGTNEIIVGDGVVKQYEGLEVGKKVRWAAADWTVVGRFTDQARHRRVRSLGRHPRGAAGLASRQQLSVDSREAAESGRAQDAQGCAHQGSARARRRAERARVLRRSAEAHVHHHQHRGLGAGHHDGHRGVVRRAEHALQRGRDARARNRHAARAGFRRLPGGGVGAGRGHDPRCGGWPHRRRARASCS